MTSSSVPAAPVTGTIRYWAAARQAAGTPEEGYQGRTLAEALAAARGRHPGPRFDEVLARCSFVVDGAPVGTRDHAEVALRDGGTVEVLPPFAGGSGGARQPATRRHTGRTASTAPRAGVRPQGPSFWSDAVVPAGAAVGAAGVLVLAAYAGQVVLALAVLILQACLVLLWGRVTAPVDPRGEMVIAGAAAVGADAAVVLADDVEPTVGPVAAVLGLVVVACLVQQVLRRDGHAGAISSAAASVTLGALVTLAAGVLAAQATEGGPALVACVAGGAALVVCSVPLRALRLPRAVASGFTLALAAGLGYLVGTTSVVVGPVRGAVLGGVGGIVTAAMLAVAARPRGMADPAGGARPLATAPTAREQHALAAVVSLTIACSLAYVLGRLAVS